MRTLPIRDCTECPKFNEEPPYYECTLSDTRHYEKDDRNWVDWLIQYCPLEHFEDIIDKAFKEGQEYEKNKQGTIRQVKSSVEPKKWFTTQEFMEKIMGVK